MKNMIVFLMILFPTISQAVVTKDCPDKVTIELVEFRPATERELSKDLLAGVDIETLLDLSQELSDVGQASLELTKKSVHGSVCDYRADGAPGFGASARLAGSFSGGGQPRLSISFYPRNRKISSEIRRLEVSLIVKSHSVDGFELAGRATNWGIAAYPPEACDAESGHGCGFIGFGTLRVRVAH